MSRSSVSFCEISITSQVQKSPVRPACRAIAMMASFSFDTSSLGKLLEKQKSRAVRRAISLQNERLCRADSIIGNAKCRSGRRNKWISARKCWSRDRDAAGVMPHVAGIRDKGARDGCIQDSNRAGRDVAIVIGQSAHEARG